MKKIIIFLLAIIFILFLATVIKAQQYSVPVTVVVKEVILEVRNLITGYGSGKGSSENYNVDFNLKDQPSGNKSSENYNMELNIG